MILYDLPEIQLFRNSTLRFSMSSYLLSLPETQYLLCQAMAI